MHSGSGHLRWDGLSELTATFFFGKALRAFTDLLKYQF